jgi:hypothetical protein
MIYAAIYARRSNDQNVAEEAKSVVRQIENATAFATTKGWTVDPSHVSWTMPSPGQNSPNALAYRACEVSWTLAHRSHG